VQRKVGAAGSCGHQLNFPGVILVGRILLKSAN
jgi:hypothetical protein